MANPVSSAPVHELVLTRFIDATPHALYRGWTEPALLVKWFVPPPWSVASAHIELRPGGARWTSRLTVNGRRSKPGSLAAVWVAASAADGKTRGWRVDIRLGN